MKDARATFAGVETRESHHESPGRHPMGDESRLAECVEAWPECEAGLYDPRCCRFPKSCSPYDAAPPPVSPDEPRPPSETEEILNDPIWRERLLASMEEAKRGEIKPIDWGDLDDD
jgi:hypothetical protein